MQKQKIKTFSVTREDDMDSAVVQVETQVNEWLENNPDYTMTDLTVSCSTSPETDYDYASHTAAIVVTYTANFEPATLKSIATPPMIDVMPIVPDLSKFQPFSEFDFLG